MTRSALILPGRLAVLALCLTPLLTGCGDKEKLASASRPGIERVTPPARSPIADPALPCPTTSAPDQMCFTDEQIGDIMKGQEKDIDARDRMLCWLRSWFGYPACDVLTESARRHSFAPHP